MDGDLFRVIMFKSSLLIMALIFIDNLEANEEEAFDLDFLEWLGETAEIEEIGVDIDELLKQQEQSEEQKTEGGLK